MRPEQPRRYTRYRVVLRNVQGMRSIAADGCAVRGRPRIFPPRPGDRRVVLRPGQHYCRRTVCPRSRGTTRATASFTTRLAGASIPHGARSALRTLGTDTGTGMAMCAAACIVISDRATLPVTGQGIVLPDMLVTRTAFLAAPAALAVAAISLAVAFSATEEVSTEAADSAPAAEVDAVSIHRARSVRTSRP
jgi:hypothetical protein